jgi:hypothetical protein
LELSTTEIPGLITEVLNHCFGISTDPAEIASEFFESDVAHRKYFNWSWNIDDYPSIDFVNIKAGTGFRGWSIDPDDWDPPTALGAALANALFPRDVFMDIHIKLKKNVVGPIPENFSDLWDDFFWYAIP